MARTVLEVARELVDALGVRFGEVTIQVAGEEITLVRQTHTLKPDALARLEVAPARPAD